MKTHECLVTDNEILLVRIKKIVKNPKIKVVPILKNVEDTIAGIIIRMENGFEIPPVRYNKTAN